MRDLSNIVFPFNYTQCEIFEKIDFNKAYHESNILFDQYRFKLVNGIQKNNELHYMDEYESKRKTIKGHLIEYESLIRNQFTQVSVQVEPHSTHDYNEFYHDILFQECIALQIYQENQILQLDHFANELLIDFFIKLQCGRELNYISYSNNKLQFLYSKEE
ncbi:hypothetical protein QWY87_12915 [Lutimonas halocynthiae]|uniref:hypothetical protein n=1 Tax=Lutimonas halocynthiae TaxID=1446477 RepID=UPI0025B3023A|nr:hypothetical protein [Lutimonas halocynthiae]MDN3643611.1 hypothetical protein [Lutimonas halocynthiae]